MGDIANPCGGVCTGKTGSRVHEQSRWVDQPLNIVPDAGSYTIAMTMTMACKTSDCDPWGGVSDGDNSLWCTYTDNNNGVFVIGNGKNLTDVEHGTQGLGHPGVGTEFSFTCNFDLTKTSSRVTTSFKDSFESFTPSEILPNPHDLHAYYFLEQPTEKVLVSQLQIEICSTIVSTTTSTTISITTSTTTSITTSITTTISTTTTLFDCNAALDNAERAWSQEKKTWCCLSTMGARGCTTSTTQTTTTLNAQCTTKSPKKQQQQEMPSVMPKDLHFRMRLCWE